jgi:hypothetical protein
MMDAPNHATQALAGCARPDVANGVGRRRHPIVLLRAFYPQVSPT